MKGNVVKLLLDRTICSSRSRLISFKSRILISSATGVWRVPEWSPKASRIRIPRRSLSSSIRRNWIQLWYEQSLARGGDYVPILDSAIETRSYSSFQFDEIQAGQNESFYMRNIFQIMTFHFLHTIFAKNFKILKKRSLFRARWLSCVLSPLNRVLKRFLICLTNSQSNENIALARN